MSVRSTAAFFAVIFLFTSGFAKAQTPPPPPPPPPSPSATVQHLHANDSVQIRGDQPIGMTSLTFMSYGIGNDGATVYTFGEGVWPDGKTVLPFRTVEQNEVFILPVGRWLCTDGPHPCAWHTSGLYEFYVSNGVGLDGPNAEIDLTMIKLK